MTIVTLRPTPSRLVEPVDAPEQYYRASPDRQLVADPVRRRRTDFVSDGVRLAGHLYRPAGAVDAEPTPTIVMCGPASSVKEQTLPHYAERLASNGLAFMPNPEAFSYYDRTSIRPPPTSSNGWRRAWTSRSVPDGPCPRTWRRSWTSRSLPGASAPP
jgi:hypothetical protein